MENQGNPSVMELTVKAGETIILKGEDGATISEVKKPKRNTQKEREWEQSKYHRFTFLVDKPQAERFIELLSGKRPLDWFREQITTCIDKNTLNVNSHTLNEKRELEIENYDLKNRLEVALKMNAIENNQELATLKAEMSKAFKLDYEDFLNSKDKEHSQELFDIYRVIISRFFKGLEKFGITYNTFNVNKNTLNLDAGNDDQTSFPDEKPKHTQKRPPNTDARPPITPEILAKWAELNTPADGSKGLSFENIAKTIDGFGYSTSTIKTRIREYRKQQERRDE